MHWLSYDRWSDLIDCYYRVALEIQVDLDHRVEMALLDLRAEKERMEGRDPKERGLEATR